MKLAPTIGFNEDASSPVNIAMNSLYTHVRYQNSGHANYDAPDLMIYCLAMADIYAHLNWLIRIYGIANLFTQKNRYLPEKILAAEGIDYNSIRDNLASFRYGINLMINKASSLCVPAAFTLFVRRAFLYQGIYTEGSSIKDQMYMYSPDGFYKYTLNDDGAGMLQYRTTHGRVELATPVTYSDLLTEVNDMLNAIIESEDCQIMSGDILKAYGESNIIKLGVLPDNYTVIPSFDIAVLEQMKNAIIFPGLVNGNDIVQDANHAYLTCNPSIAFTNGYQSSAPTSDLLYAARTMATKPVITTSTADPDASVVMENTRLMAGVREMSTELIDNVRYYEFDLYTGSEFAVDLWCLSFPFNMTEPQVVFPARFYQYSSTALRYATLFHRAQDSDIFDTLAQLVNYKFCPGFFMYRSKLEGSELTIYATFIVDIDNFATIEISTLKNIHETALMSELNTPALNRV